MAALTAAKTTLRFAPDVPPGFQTFPALTNAKFYKGAFVVVVRASGLAQPCDGDADDDDYVGICEEDLDMTGVASGAKRVKVRTNYVLCGVAVAGGTIDDIAKPVFAATDNPDDLTLTSAAVTAGVAVGRVENFRSATDMDIRGHGKTHNDAADVTS